jgi:hypothetical protein
MEINKKKKLIMSYILNFKKWRTLNENSSLMDPIFEQAAVTEISFTKHKDVIAAGQTFAKTPKDGKALPYGKTIEYAGTELYCKTDPSMYKADANNSQLPMNIYAIVKSKFGCPVPMYVSSVFVDARGKVFANQSEQRQLASDKMLMNVIDETSSGFKGLDPVWNDYATSTFLQYCQNLKYWKWFQFSINSNKDVWKKAAKATSGMGKCLQTIVDKCLNPPAEPAAPATAAVTKPAATTKPGVKS